VTVSIGNELATPAAPSAGRLRPLGLREISLKPGFWRERQEINRTASLAHIEHWLEKTGWLGNFDAAAEGRLPGARLFGREHPDLGGCDRLVIATPDGVISEVCEALAPELMRAFLAAKFTHEARHERRLAKVMQIEAEN